MSNPLPIIAGIVLLLLVLSSPEKGPGNSVNPFSSPTCKLGEVPHNYMVDLPTSWRQKNYGPSCVWATTISLLRAQGLFEEADWIRQNRSGGAYPSLLNSTLDKLHVPYVYTTDGDTRVLEYALKTNRGCLIGYGPYHATMLVGKQNGQAIILDNNHVTRYTKLPWDEFVSRWKRCPPEGGWACVIVSNKTAPYPEVPKL